MAVLQAIQLLLFLMIKIVAIVVATPFAAITAATAIIVAAAAVKTYCNNYHNYFERPSVWFSYCSYPFLLLPWPVWPRCCRCCCCCCRPPGWSCCRTASRSRPRAAPAPLERSGELRNYCTSTYYIRDFRSTSKSKEEVMQEDGKKIKISSSNSNNEENNCKKTK